MLFCFYFLLLWLWLHWGKAEWVNFKVRESLPPSLLQNRTNTSRPQVPKRVVHITCIVGTTYLRLVAPIYYQLLLKKPNAWTLRIRYFVLGGMEVVWPEKNRQMSIKVAQSPINRQIWSHCMEASWKGHSPITVVQVKINWALKVLLSICLEWIHQIRSYFTYDLR